MNFLDLAKSRCTTRGFLSEPLAADDLDYVLQAGRVAPSACNRQPQRIVVVQRPENLRKVEKAYATFGAPCVLIVCQDQSDPLVRPWDQKGSGDLDLGIVCDHMMLAARERNLGSVMVGLFDPDIIRAGFDIPPHIAPTALILLGVPRDGFRRPDRHATERRPLGQTVCFETCADPPWTPN